MVRIRYFSSGPIFKFHFLDCRLDVKKQPARSAFPTPRPKTDKNIQAFSFTVFSDEYPAREVSHCIFGHYSFFEDNRDS